LVCVTSLVIIEVILLCCVSDECLGFGFDVVLLQVCCLENILNKEL
jgi:hypothetical protein